MTEGELGLEIDFGHGAVKVWQIEERVIAETAGAARGVAENHRIVILQIDEVLGKLVQRDRAKIDLLLAQGLFQELARPASARVRMA